MATFKTPGVYVQEITKFPPSVAPVATAIPAFIGYTEKATELSNGDLTMVPKRITSMVDYELYFGVADSESGIEVDVTADNTIVVSNDTPSDYKMYYSLQMYFANGGGPCYVTSVGSYADAIILGDSVSGLLGGLAMIRKEDEPTLLLFPDSQALSSADYYAVNQAALTQCADLQDRFAIFDTYGDGSSAIADFRTGIGVDNLKYGACYYPFLDTILDYSYADADVDVTNNSFALPQVRITTIKDAIDIAGFLVDVDSYDSAKTVFDGTPSMSLQSGLVSKATKMLNDLVQFKSQLEAIVTIGREENDDTAVIASTDALDAWILANLDSLIPDLQNKIDKLKNDNTTTKVGNSLTSINALLVIAAGPVTDISTALTAALSSEVDTLISDFDTLNGGAPAPSPLSAYQTTDNDLYNRIKAAISDYPVTLPPSSAMAGIYARIDNAIGVWKAPANVTVRAVQQPTVRISNEDQEDMNVTSTGKSVNAIRTFVGKGTLVWGARTLAGNDNEWRYIPVRRLFNFVEESVSEATEQFVFEPNVSSTWVRIRTMIENFLTDIWKSGALAGATPEDAFYVRVGLGQTMTSQDILEGRMIVEIGMAAVRPAEFIVLRFSHKMQES